MPSNLRLIDGPPLRSLVRPPQHPTRTARAPVLCFLHGYDEGAPLDIYVALTRHGPLKQDHTAADEFLVIAPQLPVRGDLWDHFAAHVRTLVARVREEYDGDAERTYLTGFSFGGNGVFDLALAQPDVWAALWAVDPTRVPLRDPGRPVWVSIGEVARFGTRRFVQRLNLRAARESVDGDRVYLDQGADHVRSATMAYQDEQIYGWLRSKALASP